MLMSVTLRLAGLDRNWTKLAVADAFLGDHRLGERHDGGGGPAQNHALEAVIVIQMGMQRGYGYIMVRVLHGSEPSR